MAEETASSILRAATELLREHPFDDIAYRTLAETVGISERTVFRQFPTRDHLLEATAAWIDIHEFTPFTFTTVPEFRAESRRAFREYDASPAFATLTARASTMSSPGTGQLSEQTIRLDRLLYRDYPQLNSRDRQRALASLRLFTSASFWTRMRSDFDMDADEIADSFDWSVTQTLSALRLGRAVTP